MADSQKQPVQLHQSNPQNLIDQVALELNLPRRTAAAILDGVLDSIAEMVRIKGKISIRNFGTFSRCTRKGREYALQITKKKASTKYKETVIFKASATFIRGTSPTAQPRKRGLSGNPFRSTRF